MVYDYDLLTLFIAKRENRESYFPLPERKKYELIEELYATLPQNSKYLMDFYNTLSILDAGYMSDKKDEALRIFREIYTIPAIPKGRREDFKASINEFLKRDRISYTTFKIDILSSHIVNVDTRYLDRLSLRVCNASDVVDEIEELEEDRRRKIKEWLSGVYLLDDTYKLEFKYDRNLGLILKEKKEYSIRKQSKKTASNQKNSKSGSEH